MDKLAEALEAKKGDKSLRTVAGEIGVAPGTVEGWLKAWRRPGYKHLRPLADYLDEDIEMIVTWIMEEEGDTGEDDDTTLRKGVSRSWARTSPVLAAA